jgi:ureidoacrylate peracid hydrolase
VTDDLSLLDPRKSALLVIDMENAFCHPDGTLGRSGVDVTAAREAITRVRCLVEACQATDVPVIWIMQQHFVDDRSRARKRLVSHTQKRVTPPAIAGTWDAELVDELAPLVVDPTLVVTKHRFGAFHETRLDQLLRMLGVTTVVVSGVFANTCVETTIREAYMYDYDVVVADDAVAAVDPAWGAAARPVWDHYLALRRSSADIATWLLEVSGAMAVDSWSVRMPVRNLDAASAFYVGALGFRVQERRDDVGEGALLRLVDGPTLMETADSDSVGVTLFVRMRGRRRLPDLAECGGRVLHEDVTGTVLDDGQGNKVHLLTGA